MKKVFLSTLSLFLVCVMLAGSFAACAPLLTEDQSSDTSSNETTDDGTQGSTEGDTSTAGSETGLDTETETETENKTETETETETGNASISGSHADIIEHAHNLANGVTSYFTDATRKYHSIQNQEMTLTYARSIDDDQRVASIKNTQGKSYIEDTMDVFIRMKNGKEFYASQSPNETDVNIFRFGYYYYQGFYGGQSFVPKNYGDSMDKTASLDLKKDIDRNSGSIKMSLTKDALTGTIIKDSDPKFFTNQISYSTKEYNVLNLTIKTVGNVARMQVFFRINGQMNEQHSKWINLNTDGEYHTYVIPFFDFPASADGTIEQIRFDPMGAVDEGFSIKDISFGYTEFTDCPQYVKLNRQFHVYSDKMHHEIQVNVSQTTTDVDVIGVRTEVAKNTVDKLLIVDNKEKTYTSLAGIDWTTVTAVGFDIKDAGIFGYIMPYDGKGGVIKVTEEGDNYVIIREITPPDNTLNPSLAGSKNRDDFYTGCRVYTDENHDFEEFLYENMCEQKPLVLGKNIKVSEVNSDVGSFEGYDSLRGIYVFNLSSPLGSFWTPYNNPNKNYKVNFTISTSDVDRDVYVMSSCANGLLECAAFFDKDMMMLPMPIEVIKNFVDTKNNFNIDDYTFSEAIIPLTLTVGEKNEYTLMNLYQLWGKFPLKQISQIPFHLPYYHLSTGVTETNCITPWYLTTSTTKDYGRLTTLPDHRAWSAPMWDSQPQHTNSGAHHWLEYTDTTGKFVAVENTFNTITSFGPTYAEVVMDHISDDGKMKVTYTHMEMPQTDENRAYYTMEYTVLEDISIKDFKKNFQFFSIGSNDLYGEYRNISYLDENNKSAYVDATLDLTKSFEYKLGDKNPYFTFYYMPPYDKTNEPKGYEGNGYSNLSFLVFDSEFVLGGKEYDPEYVIINTQCTVKLTLDLDDVTLKAGDKFTINAIVMPWGSQNSVYDGSNGLAPDQNVLDVRENTCIDPLTVKSETDEVIESTFVPKVKSKDGKVAEFTLSGCKTSNTKRTEGKNAIAVRVYGFDMLTAPKIEEFVDGKWVEYDVSSKDTPDLNGYYHYYDGYCVYYDGDGTYSYSFVVDMTEGKERKFRLKADTEFEGWPTEVPPDASAGPLLVYVDAQKIQQKFKVVTPSTLSDDLKYCSTKVTTGKREIYETIYTNLDSTPESGQYLVIKYRIPSTNAETVDQFEFFVSTENDAATWGDHLTIAPVNDGEWHVAVIDLSTYTSHKTFTATDDKYYAKYIRFDPYNKTYTDSNNVVDVEFVGMDSDLMKICTLVAEDFKAITLYENGIPGDIDTATGKVKKPVYVDPESGYTQAEGVKYFARIDQISGASPFTTSSYADGKIILLNNRRVNDKNQVTFAGWCVVEGGAEKYVWSVDSGKTWNDFAGNETLSASSQAMLDLADGQVGEKFSTVENTGKNGRFQENGNLVADLSAYEGKVVDFIIAVIPAKDTKTLIPLFCLDDIKCEKQETVFVSEFDENSKYTESRAAYGARIDDLNDGIIKATACGNVPGVLVSTKEINVSEYYNLNIKGWAAVDGGIEKYVWTADKGKTWHDCEGNPITADNGILGVAKGLSSGFTHDDEASKKNGCFQNDHALEIDLADYKNSTTPLEIWICAVNAADTTKATVLFKLKNVKVTP